MRRVLNDPVVSEVQESVVSARVDMVMKAVGLAQSTLVNVMLCTTLQYYWIFSKN